MFGLEFLFTSALLALPVAGLPVLLHMLFRRKSPVVHFPTLRFIKASIQQTAARRKIQRWVLLACRVLLLLLLIWTVAQPVRMLASGWFKGGQSVIAAIVVDTSYSMQLRQNEMTLLDRANDIIGEMLREPLKDAKVAIFRSGGSRGPEKLETVAKVQSEWTQLRPEAAGGPLYNRCAAAVEFLNRQQANQKWLVILSDLQSREFPGPLPELKEGRVVLFDLRPEEPRSAGIGGVKMEPEQPIPGIGAQVVVEVSGRAGDARAMGINVTKLDGTALKQVGPLMASFDAAGKSKVRAALAEGLPVEKWLLVRAQLQGEDDLAWDNSRAQLVELPPRQSVTLIEAAGLPGASSFVRLALDPWEGKVGAWPLDVKRAGDLTGRESVAVVLVSEWPDLARTAKLAGFVRNGGTLILLLQPGLEQGWGNLTAQHKSALMGLLPAAVAPTLAGGGAAGVGMYRPVAPVKADRVLEGLTDATFRLNQLAVRRFVPFAEVADPAVSTLLHLSPMEGDARKLTSGMLYKRTVGNGAVFTLATMPESRYISPPTHPLFLPMLVSMALRPPEQRDAQNLEIGQPMVLAGNRYSAHEVLEVQNPKGERFRVQPVNEAGGRKFVFMETAEPGLYWWRTVDGALVVALGNVQLPAAESDLIYRGAETVVTAGGNCVVARSFAELQGTVAKINEPQAKWTWPLAMVLLLMCFEAMLASMSQLWKPISWRSLLGRGQ